MCVCVCGGGGGVSLRDFHRKLIPKPGNEAGGGAAVMYWCIVVRARREGKYSVTDTRRCTVRKTDTIQAVPTSVFSSSISWSTRDCRVAALFLSLNISLRCCSLQWHTAEVVGEVWGGMGGT